MKTLRICLWSRQDSEGRIVAVLCKPRALLVSPALPGSRPWCPKHSTLPAHCLPGCTALHSLALLARMKQEYCRMLKLGALSLPSHSQKVPYCSVPQPEIRSWVCHEGEGNVLHAQSTPSHLRVCPTQPPLSMCLHSMVGSQLLCRACGSSLHGEVVSVRTQAGEVT